MITPSEFVDSRRSPELAPCDNTHVVVQTSLVKICDKRGEAVIVQRQKRTIRFKERGQAVRAMVIPQAHLHRYKRHSCFNETASADEGLPVPEAWTFGRMRIHEFVAARAIPVE